MAYDVEVLRAVIECDDSNLNAVLKRADAKLQAFASKTYQPVKVTVDSKGAVKEITDLGRAMRAIVDKNVTVHVNTSGAVAQVTALGNALQAVQRQAQATQAAGESSRATPYVLAAGPQLRAAKAGIASNATPEAARAAALRNAVEEEKGINTQAVQAAIARERALADMRSKELGALRADIQNRYQLQDEAAKKERQAQETYGAAMAQTEERRLKQMGQMTDRFGNLLQQRAGLEERIQSLQNSGYRQLRAGSILTATITAPIIAGGTEVTRYAMDFESSMARSAALTEIGRKGIEAYKRQVLDLVKDDRIVSAPKELGDAFFFAASKTKSGADAMGVLRASAVGAAGDLGKVQDVVEGTTTVLNAYKMGGDQAAHVTDIFVQSAKEGGVAADTFAKALPKVVATASAVGVSIEEVAASIATMTRVGIPAGNAATALNRLLLNMEKPSKQAQAAVAKLGLSFGQLRIELKDKGLMAVLDEVVKKAGNQADVLAPIFGSVNSFRAVLATAGSQADTYAHILDKMFHSQGAAAEAAGVASGTLEGRLNHLKAVVAALAIDLGDKLLPELTSVVETMGKNLPGELEHAIRAWQMLPTPIKDTTLALIALLALAGPVNMMAGNIKILGAALLGMGETLGVNNIAASVKSLYSLLRSGVSLSGAVGLSGIGESLAGAGTTMAILLPFIAAGTIAWIAYKENLDKVNAAHDALDKNAGNLKTDLQGLASAATGNAGAEKSVKRISDAVQDAGTDLTKLGQTLDDVTAARREIKNINLDPVAKQVLEDDYERLAHRIEDRIIKVKIEADASSQGLLSWLASAGQGGLEVLGLGAAPPKHYDASTPGRRQAATAATMISPGIPGIASPQQLQNLQRAAQLMQVIQGSTAKIRVDAMHGLDIGSLSEKSLTQIHDAYLARFRSGYSATEGEDRALGDVNNRLKSLADKRKADAQKAADAAKALAQQAATDQAAIEEENADRIRRILAQQMQARAEVWNRYASLVEGMVGRIREIEEQGSDVGARTQKAKTEAELAKREFAEIPSHVKQWAVELAGVEDKMKDILDLRNGFKELFTGMAKGMTAAQFTQFKAQVGGVEDALGLDDKFKPLQQRYRQLAPRAVGYADVVRAGYNQQAESLQEAGKRTGGVYATGAGNYGTGGSFPPYVQSMISQMGRNVGLQCGEAITAVFRRNGINMTATSLAHNPRYRIQPDAQGRYPEGAMIHEYPHSGSGPYKAGHYGLIHYDNGRPMMLDSNFVGHDRVGMHPLKDRDFSRAAVFMPPGYSGTIPANTKVAQTAASIPALNITKTPARPYTLPGSPDFDTSLLDINNLPRAWGGMMADHIKQSGEVTSHREAAEARLQDIISKLPEGMKLSDAALQKTRMAANTADFDASVNAAETAMRGRIQELYKSIRLVGRDNNPYLALEEEFAHGANRYNQNQALRNAQLAATLGAMAAQTQQATREFVRDRQNESKPLSENAGLLGTGYSPAAYDRAKALTAARVGIYNSADIVALNQVVEQLNKEGRYSEAAAKAKLIHTEATKRLTAAEQAYTAAAVEGALHGYADAQRAQQQSIGLLEYEAQLLKANTLSREAQSRALEVEKVRRSALDSLAPAVVNGKMTEAQAAAAAGDAATAKNDELGIGRNNERERALQDYNIELTRSIRLLDLQGRAYATIPAYSPALQQRIEELNTIAQLNARYAGKRDAKGHLGAADQGAYDTEMADIPDSVARRLKVDAIKEYGSRMGDLDRTFASLGDSTGIMALQFDLMNTALGLGGDRAALLDKTLRNLKATMDADTTKQILGEQSQNRSQYIQSARGKLDEQLRLRDATTVTPPGVLPAQRANDARLRAAADLQDANDRQIRQAETVRDLQNETARTEKQRVAIAQAYAVKVREILGITETQAEKQRDADEKQKAALEDRMNRIKKEADAVQSALGNSIYDALTGKRDPIRNFFKSLWDDIARDAAERAAGSIRKRLFGAAFDRIAGSVDTSAPAASASATGATNPGYTPGINGSELVRGGVAAAHGDLFGAATALLGKSRVPAAGVAQPITGAVFTVNGATVQMIGAQVTAPGSNINAPGAVINGAGGSGGGLGPLASIFGGGGSSNSVEQVATGAALASPYDLGF